ncbi:MAG: hypothetical protein WC761_01465 [Candidatus Paceibacterota bacterium]|jgi:hypothetical protein
MATNIDTAVELNKLLQQQNQLYLTQAKIMRGQMVMLKQMLDLFKQIDPKSLQQGWSEFGDSVKEAEEAMNSMASSSQETLSSVTGAVSKGSSTMLKMGGNLKGLGKGFLALAGPVGILATMSGGFETAMSAGEGLLNVLMSVASGIGNVAIAIITAPFKMLQTLIDGIGQGSTELAQALENVRKQFGDLRTGASKAIIDISKGMQGQLAETGLRTYRVFGNLAERLKTIAEYAGNLGPLFNNLAAGLVANGEAFGAYVKGLGLTEAGLKGVGRLALSTGQDFTEVGRQITGMAYQMGEAFGINGRQISESVGDMLNDVRNFGSLSIKQLTQVSVFANRLGLSFQDLQGTIDQFDNFESAAESAAQLSQAFGLNVDALQLIQEQDPAARFETIRKAFYQTGRSVEQMTRQEMRLLATQTGLSEEAVKLGFSLENQGVNYADVQKQAGLAETKQLSQAEAMQKLSGSIERLVKSGEMGQGGFFDRFFQGFLRGITLTKDFRAMMMTLRQALRATFQAGRELGQIFVKTFPGVRDVFGGITDFFSIARWKKMLGDVVKAFAAFFKDLTTNPTAGLKSLFTKLQKSFFDNFDTKKQAGRRILEGIGTFYKTLFNIAVGMIQIGIEQIGNSFKNIFTPGTLENDAVKWIASLLKTVWDYVRDFDYTSAFAGIIEAAKSSFALIFETLKTTIIPAFLDVFNSLDFSSVGNRFETLLPMLLNTVTALRKSLIDFIVSLPFDQIIAGMGRVASSILSFIKGAIVTASQLVIPFVEAALGQFLDMVEQIPWASILGGLLTTIYDLLTTAAIFVWGRLPPLLLGLLSEAVQGLLRLAPRLLSAIGTWASGMVEGVATFFSDFGPMLRDKLAKAIPEILTAWVGLMSDAFNFVRDELPGILTDTAWEAVRGLARIFNSIPGLILGAFSFAGNAIAGIFEGIGSWIKTTFPEFYAAVEPVINILRGIGIVVGRAMGTARKAILDWAQNTAIPFYNAMKTTFTNLWTSFKTAATPVFDYATKKFEEFRTFIGTIIEQISSISTAIQAALGITSTGPSPLDAIIARTRAGFAQLEQIGREGATSVQASANQAATAAASSATGGVTGQAPGEEGFAGLFGGSEATKKRAALDELNNIRVPSPARVARLERDIQNVTDRYTKGIVNNIRDLVAAVNTITTDLGSLGDSPQRINVQLKQLANNLGVGGNQRLEIKNRNFTIQLNVNVVLDADEFEEALTTRPGGSTFTVRSDGGP